MGKGREWKRQDRCIKERKKGKGFHLFFLLPHEVGDVSWLRRGKGNPRGGAGKKFWAAGLITVPSCLRGPTQ
jgi:hypothetical protein